MENSAAVVSSDAGDERCGGMSMRPCGYIYSLTKKQACCGEAAACTRAYALRLGKIWYYNARIVAGML
jgi:hypothetical protein